MAGYSNYGGPNSAHTIDYSCIDPLLRPAVNQSQNVQVQPRLLTDSPAVNQSQNARVQPRLRPAVNRSQNARVQPRLRPAVNRSQNAEVQHTLLTSNSGSARIGPFGIPINDIHRMIRDPYDATWASTWGIDHATLAAKGHKKTYETFEALYTNGVIKTDDELYRVCSHTVNGVTTQVEKVAKITGSVRTADGKLRPAMDLYSEGISYPKLLACKGVGTLAEAFKNMPPSETGRGDKAPHSFHGIQVRRGTKELGTLYEVRQTWTAWRSEMDDWASTNGVTYRLRRAKKQSKRKSNQSLVADESGN